MREFWDRAVLCLLLAMFVSLTNNLRANELPASATIQTSFAEPSRDYTNAPLWVWNSIVTDEMVRQSLQELASQGIKQAFVHPRPGLMTTYLSDEWFRLWEVALAEAKRLDMNLWIYDENSYPSGFAGGWVPELMPEARGRNLVIDEQPKAPDWSSDLVAVLKIDEKGVENVTPQVRTKAALGEGRFAVCKVIRAQNSGWTAGRCYVDLLYPGVTEKFLEVTLEPYRQRFGSEFGKRIPGSFTDEPELMPTGSGFPWTDDLPEVFQKRWGYSLLDHLASLQWMVGDYKQVRHDYFQCVLDLFTGRWGKPYHDYCEKNKLQLTGHYWEHEWPNCLMVPDNMAMYYWHQRPAIDVLLNQYGEGTHAQFGNTRAVRELSSIGNQLGRRTLSETYGAAGWDLRFEDMKRIGDWEFALGVNTMNEHLSDLTLRGSSKRDHPQSFSYHEPWWDSYHVIAHYFSRLSVALTAGEQRNRVLLIEPTTTAWMYHGDEQSRKHLAELGDRFQDLINLFEREQVEYDIGCEDVIARVGKVDDGKFVIGQRGYDLVVLPPLTENLAAETTDLLETWMKASAGNKPLICSLGGVPSRVDGRESARVAKLAGGKGWMNTDVAGIVREIRQAIGDDGLSIQRAADDKGILFHHRRRLADGQLLFLANTSLEASSVGVIEAEASGAEQLNLWSAKVEPYRFDAVNKTLKAAFNIPPCGSLLLFLSNRPCPGASAEPRWTEVPPVQQIQIRRIEPNVLTLDYVDVTAGGESKKGEYSFSAAQFVFQKHGLPGNPWETAVQFKDEIISKTFPADSGFEAAYHFTIEQAVPENLAIVIENPELYSIACNGKPVAVEPGRWWLDRSFGRMNLAALAQVGENTVTVTAKPMSVYQTVEAAYLLGDFTLRAVDKGFVVVADHPLELGKWNEQGHPFYAAGVAYTQRFNVGQVEGRYVVAVPQWYGSVAKVFVNGELAGHIVCAPWECEVTARLKNGENVVEVVVIGTLKNTLGPFHGKPGLGIAGPGSFQQGPSQGPPPGSQYSNVGYGLFEPFILKHAQ